jgi:ribosomal 50S subunit-recycling heat shock protein
VRSTGEIHHPENDRRGAAQGGVSIFFICGRSKKCGASTALENVSSEITWNTPNARKESPGRRCFDNLVYRAGFASSRAQARQLILHGHFQLNGRAVNIPSALLREGDIVSVKEIRRNRVKGILEANEKRDIPSWLEKNQETMQVQVVAPPLVEQIGYQVDTNLIVEFYSR